MDEQQQLDLARAATILAKKQAQNRKKRERQKAKAKAALQQVRAAEAHHVPPAAKQPAKQPEPELEPEPEQEQQQQQLPVPDVNEQSLAIAEVAQRVNEMEHGLEHPFRDTAAASDDTPKFFKGQATPKAADTPKFFEGQATPKGATFPVNDPLPYDVLVEM